MKFLHKLKKTIDGLRTMSRLSADILRGGLLISCAMLLGSLMILFSIGEPSADTMSLYFLARELYRAPAGLLLVAVILSAVFEESARA